MKTARSIIENALGQAENTFAVLANNGKWGEPWVPDWFRKEARKHQRRLSKAIKAMDSIIEQENI
jgi:hypothetical protein